MKRTVVLLMTIFIAITSCSKKEPVVVLEQDSPAYALAKGLSEKIPYYDPDQNNVLISTKYFDITAAEMIQILQRNYGKRAEQLRSFNPDRIKKIIDQNADQLAQRKLLIHAAGTYNIQVTEEEVDSLINDRYISRGGEDKFLSWLKNNNIDIETVREDTREALMIDKYSEAALGKLTAVSDKELMDKYNEDKTASVQHILIKTQGLDDSTKAVKYEEAKALLARAKNGEDFGELAREYSEDPGSNKNGGLYENFTRGRMVQPFEDAAFNTPIGEFSDVVETTYGYHVMKVLDRKKEEKPFEEVRDKIKAKLEQDKRDDAYQKNIDKLKKKAKLKVIEY